MIESSSSEFQRGNGTSCNSQTECARLTQSQPIMISAHRASFPQILARELEFGFNLCASEVGAFVLIVLLPAGQPKAGVYNQLHQEEPAPRDIFRLNS